MDQIINEFHRSAEILACRIAGAPFEYYTIEGKIHPKMVFWQKQDINRAIIEAAISLSKSERKYSALSLSSAIKAEKESSYSVIIQKGYMYADHSIAEAFDYFSVNYARFIEMQIADQSKFMLSNGASSEEIRRWQDEYRRDNGLNNTSSIQADGKAEFQKRFEDAIMGRVPEYEFIPHITGLRHHITAYKPGDVVVVMAETGHGKTYFANNIITGCIANRQNCAYVNLEMQDADVYERLWQINSGIEFKDDLSKLSPAQMQKAAESAKAVLEDSTFRIISPGRNAETILREMQKEFYERGTRMYIIDYVQMMKLEKSGKIRTYELDEIIYSVRAFAKDNNVVVIELAMIGRSISTRGGSGRPRLSDLKDSASIEQAAALVIALYRPYKHGITEKEDGTPVTANDAEIIVLKGRKTGEAIIECQFDHIRGFYDADLPEFDAVAHSEGRQEFFTQTVFTTPSVPRNDTDIPF